MARGSVVKRASGRYAIVYPARGRQVWETLGRSKRDAESILEQRLDELRRGTWRHPRNRQEAESELTLAAYAERWLERQDPSRVAAPVDGRFPRRRVAASTFYTYRGDLHRHVLPALGETPLATLTTEHVDALVADLERAGKAPGTIRIHHHPAAKVARRGRAAAADPCESGLGRRPAAGAGLRRQGHTARPLLGDLARARPDGAA